MGERYFTAPGLLENAKGAVWAQVYQYVYVVPLGVGAPLGGGGRSSRDFKLSDASRTLCHGCPLTKVRRRLLRGTVQHHCCTAAAQACQQKHGGHASTHKPLSVPAQHCSNNAMHGVHVRSAMALPMPLDEPVQAARVRTHVLPRVTNWLFLHFHVQPERAHQSWCDSNLTACERRRENAAA